MRRLITICALAAGAAHFSFAQNVGINTDSPSAPLHVYSSGQVYTPGGLVIFGNTSEARMQLDFNYLQARYGISSNLDLFIQPMGGDVMINGNPSLSPIVGPQARLHVHSPGQVLTTGGLMVLGDTSEANLRMDFNYIQASYSGNGLELDLQPEGGNLDVMDGALFVKYPEEFVGINSTNPLQELWVSGELAFRLPLAEPQQIDKIALNGNTLESAGMAGFGYLTSTPISGTSHPTRAVGSQEIYTKSEGAHRWYINKNAGAAVTPEMILDDQAQLGIQVDDPAARLHLNETGTGDLIRADVSQLTRFLVQSDGNTGVGTGFPLTDLHVASVNTNTVQILAVPDVAGSGGHSEILLGEDDDFTFGFAIRYDGIDNKLKFFGNVNDQPQGPHITIERNTGDVAIGIETVPPGYKLAVDGSIIAEGMRCELSGSWPDYVFEEGYALMPMADLKIYLDEHHHLPGMSSAGEMEEEGIDFETIAIKQQEKIEELFLYVIELQEQIDRQKAMIAELQYENSPARLGGQNQGK